MRKVESLNRAFAEQKRIVDREQEVILKHKSSVRPWNGLMINCKKVTARNDSAR